MCLKVKLTGLARCVLTVLGSVADTTIEIMVFHVLAPGLKKLGFRTSTRLLKVMKATAADPDNRINLKIEITKENQYKHWSLFFFYPLH